jgi:hypothetical protein
MRNTASPNEHEASNKITEAAVGKRIRRKLRNTAEMLRKSRGEKQRIDCGRYYVIDAELNALLWHNVDIEAYARQLGVLRAHESVFQPLHDTKGERAKR